MDYIFYKIYLYYKKKKYIPVVMGIGFLFVLEVFIFLFLAMFFNFITDQLFSTKYLSRGSIEVFCYSIYTISAVLLISLLARVFNSCPHNFLTSAVLDVPQGIQNKR